MIKRHHINHALGAALITLVIGLALYPALGASVASGGYLGREIAQYQNKKHNRSHLIGHLEDWLWAIAGALITAWAMTVFL